MTLPESNSPAPNAERAAWMRILALAKPDALQNAYDAFCAEVFGLATPVNTAAERVNTHACDATPTDSLPEHEWLRQPQTGMAMVRARAGGTGDAFNLGEMTVTRCAVSLPDGVVGVAYVQGRSADHAKRAAMLDGLLQIPRWHARIQQQVIAPLDRTRQDAADHASRKAAQTKVEFFTLVRGEN